MQVISVTFTANQTKRFELSGKYFEIISSSGPVTVDFYDQYGSDSNGALNILSGFFVEGDFSAFNIRSATAQTVEILVTGGKGGSRRQPGEVRVINSPEELTRTNNYFLGGGGVGPDATRRTVLTLKAVAKQVVVSKLEISSPTAGSLILGITTSAGTASAGGGGCQNKNAFGPVSSALFTSGYAAPGTTLTAAEGPGYRQLYGKIYVQAELPTMIEYDEPIILAPGNCIMLMTLEINRGINLNAQFKEQ